MLHCEIKFSETGESRVLEKFAAPEGIETATLSSKLAFAGP
jgi:hypothetical protein